MPNLPMLDQSRKMENSAYGEAVRLSNELRSKPKHSIFDLDGNETIIPAKNGINIETASISELLLIKPISKAQKDFLDLTIKMKSGIIPIDIELCGESGLNPKYRKKLKEIHLK